MKCVDHLTKALTLHNSKGSHVFNYHLYNDVRKVNGHLGHAWILPLFVEKVIDSAFSGPEKRHKAYWSNVTLHILKISAISISLLCK